jgi:hypothetical protein
METATLVILVRWWSTRVYTESSRFNIDPSAESRWGSTVPRSAIYETHASILVTHATCNTWIRYVHTAYTIIALGRRLVAVIISAIAPTNSFRLLSFTYKFRSLRCVPFAIQVVNSRTRPCLWGFDKNSLRVTSPQAVWHQR